MIRIDAIPQDVLQCLVQIQTYIHSKDH